MDGCSSNSLFLGSSMVEHLAVNERVAGSSPAPGARINTMDTYNFALAHRTPPTIYSDDIRRPFRDIGMGGWTDDQIGEFFGDDNIT